jgi:AmiR/NasT family two-component response regulator
MMRRLADDVATLRERTEQLQRALDSRVVIEQAKGVLAERLALPPQEAFEILRRAARSTQTPIHDLAREVVLASTTPPPVVREVARRRRLEGTP